MKKNIFMGVLGLFLLGSCANHTAHHHEHEGHNHEVEEQEAHHHEHEHEHKHEHEHEHEHEGHEHGNTDEIILTPEKAKAAGVEVSHIHPTTFHQVIKVSGQVLAAQGDERVIVANVSGVVSFNGKIVEGMAVKKESKLLSLSSKYLTDGDQAEKARIAYEVAKKEYERMKLLVADQIVSEKDFALTAQAYENARLNYEAIGKNQSINGTTVTASMAGYVKNILVKEGDYVSVGQPLVSITQNRKLFLRADLSERYYSSLKQITSANFVTPYNDQVYCLQSMNGKLLSYGKSATADSHYLPVTFEFDNVGDVIPGSFVEVYLLSSPMENVIALPHSAITEEQGSYFVYLKLDEEGYKKQLVTLGADNGESVQILSGLHAHDNVVVAGAYQVKLASATNAIPAHSHEH